MIWYSYQTFRLLSHVKQIWFENYYLISQSQKKQDTNTLYSGLLESNYLKQMFTLKEYFFFFTFLVFASWLSVSYPLCLLKNKQILQTKREEMSCRSCMYVVQSMLSLGWVARTLE